MKRILYAFTILLMISACASADLAGTILRAGAATADITPKEGVLMDGTILKLGPVKGVHDPLYARALVLQLGDRALALVVNDSCVIDQSVYDRARNLIEQETGIPGDHVLMCATHTHATPRAIHIGKGELDDEYHDLLAENIAKATADAFERLAPARLGYGAFDLADLVACRRFLCESGSVSRNPFGETGEQVKSVAGSSKAIIRPAGPVDPQVSVLSVQHVDGRPLAVLANYSVHYCGGYKRGLVSADYFGAFAAYLEKHLDAGPDHPPFVAMMSNGTSGDTGSIRLKTGKKNQPFELIGMSGEKIGEAALGCVKGIEHESPTALAVRSDRMAFDVRKPDADRLTWAHSILDGTAKKVPHKWSRIYAHEAVQLDRYPTHYDIMLQAMRVGDVGIAAIPCEVFAETGLAIKKQSPLKATFTISLANGSSGYLPTPQQHAWGGYETWPARSSHLEVKAEPKIRAKILDLLATLKNTP